MENINKLLTRDEINSLNKLELLKMTFDGEVPKTLSQKLIVSLLNKIELTEASIDDFSKLSNLLLKACNEGITQDEFVHVKLLNQKYK